MWLVKDRNGAAFLYTEKPSKDKSLGQWIAAKLDYIDMDYFGVSSDLVDWEDEEPLEVEIIIKEK